PEELEALLIAEGRALAGRADDDQAVGAVVEEVGGELSEPLVVDGAVAVERCDDGGQDLTEHAAILVCRRGCGVYRGRRSLGRQSVLAGSGRRRGHARRRPSVGP